MDKNALDDLLPHGPSMCLLDGVDSWNENGICCHTQSHRCSTNPLLDKGILYTDVLVEYGAQAAAIHAGLIHSDLGQAPKPAYVGALKNVKLLAEEVDPSTTSLIVNARVLLNNAGGAVYSFNVTADKRILIEGRLTVVLSP